MSLLPLVGRRSLKMRLIIGGIYLLLLVGAVTMVYPFLLMLTTATTGNADWREFRLVPRSWYNPAAQFRRYMLDKTSVNTLAYDYRQDGWFAMTDVTEAQLAGVLTSGINRTRIVADYAAFVASLPVALRQPTFVYRAGADYSVLSQWDNLFVWLARTYSNDLSLVKRLYDDSAVKWSDLGWPRATHASVWETAPQSPRARDFDAYMQTVPLHQLRLVPLDLLAFLELRRQYGNVAVLNQTRNCTFAHLLDVTWDRLAEVPWGAPVRDVILRSQIPLEQIRLKPEARAAYDMFVARRFPNEHFAFQTVAPDDERARAAFIQFVRSTDCSIAFFAPLDPLAHWHAALAQQYGKIARLNTAWATRYAAFADVPLPDADVDADYFLRHRATIVRQFLLGNFSAVFRHVAINGRALLNTAIYILLSIATALTINPMAAYALSRFRLKYAHHILVFLLATMAFPAEVIMIPNFLMIKSFPLAAIILCGAALLLFFIARALLFRRVPLFWSGLIGATIALLAAYYLPPRIAAALGREDLNISLMNTFAALVFPGMANAYSVFLLKGFFDSLPPELYEAAMLDGASERVMFLRITLPMCKPILAVMTLGAFTHAYGAFMFAFLTCQDPKMWTLMVFLYEFQQTYSVPLVMASLVIAALPTLLVFIACQNVILRGIVIPTFK